MNVFTYNNDPEKWITVKLTELHTILDATDNVSLKGFTIDNTKTNTPTPTEAEIVIFQHAVTPEKNVIYIPHTVFSGLSEQSLAKKAYWGDEYGICLEDEKNREEVFTTLMPTQIAYDFKKCLYHESKK